eukprot:390493_1
MSREISHDTPPRRGSVVQVLNREAFARLQHGGVQGVKSIAQQARIKAPEFEQAFCGCSFILGLLLIFVSKKLMKTILALFGALASAVVTFKIIENFIPAFQNGLVILAVCGVVALIVGIILHRMVKQVFKAVITLSLGCIVYLVHEDIQNFFEDELMRIITPFVVGIIAVSIGYFLSAKFTMPILKFIGAGLGAFLIVSSVGYFMEVRKLIPPTSFNLVTIVKSSKGYVVQRYHEMQQTEQAAQLGDAVAYGAMDPPPEHVPGVPISSEYPQAVNNHQAKVEKELKLKVCKHKLNLFKFN